MGKKEVKYYEEDMVYNISIRILQSFEEINGIRAFWEKYQWYHYANFEYYSKFAPLQDGFLRPYVICSYRNRTPAALLVGWVVERIIPWNVGYKTFHKSRARILEIAYGGVLGKISESEGNRIVKKILECLKRDGIDIVFFKLLKNDSIIHKAALEVPNLICRDHFPIENIHWKLSLPGSFKIFYQQRSKNTKSNIRKYANRIKKKFGENFRIKCCKYKDEVDQTIEEIEKVAVKTYQRGLKVGFLNTDKTKKEWLFAAEHGWLRAYVLYFEDEPCAFLNGFIYRKVFYISNLGFDPAYKYYHPGVFLFMRIIEEFCLDRRVQAIDFGPGDADYKRAYSDQNWKEVAIYIFAPTFKGLRIKMIRTSTVVVSEFIKYILNRLKILNWIKKNWRQKLVSAR